MKKEFGELKSELLNGKIKKDVAGSGKTCCMFLELETGIWTLGGFQCITVAGSMMATIYWFAFFSHFVHARVGDVVYYLVNLIFTLPMWLGGYYYLRFFMGKGKSKLPRAHVCNIITIVLTCAWAIGGGYAFYDFPMPYGPGGAAAAGAAAARGGAHGKPGGGYGAKTQGELERRIILFNCGGAFILCLVQYHWFNCAKLYA